LPVAGSQPGPVVAASFLSAQVDAAGTVEDYHRVVVEVAAVAEQPLLAVVPLVGSRGRVPLVSNSLGYTELYAVPWMARAAVHTEQLVVA